MKARVGAPQSALPLLLVVGFGAGQQDPSWVLAGGTVGWSGDLSGPHRISAGMASRLLGRSGGFFLFFVRHMGLVMFGV